MHYVCDSIFHNIDRKALTAYAFTAFLSFRFRRLSGFKVFLHTTCSQHIAYHDIHGNVVSHKMHHPVENRHELQPFELRCTAEAKCFSFLEFLQMKSNLKSLESSEMSELMRYVDACCK